MSYRTMNLRNSTFTFSGCRNPVTVYRFTTTPTDSREPMFRIELLTPKQAAIEQIESQPFFRAKG